MPINSQMQSLYHHSRSTAITQCSNYRFLNCLSTHAARHIHGRAILYADVMTGSMKQAIGETERRRNKQVAHNLEHGITPETVKRNLDDVMGEALAREFINVTREERAAEEPLLYLEDKAFEREVAKLEKHMKELAAATKFEEAAELRDRIQRARRERLLDVSGVPATGPIA